MKKVVAFILAFIIFVAPVTTLVKADVVIGDNDDTIINENATILGRKLALLESFSDLALSGVTEFTISNTNDVDSYLDSLWQEINEAIESLSDGTGFTEISDTLKSKYFSNLVQYKDYINNRGDYFAHLLPSGNPTSNLLSTFFADNIFGKHSTLKNNLSLNMFNALSRYQNNDDGNTPTPDIDYSWISNINNLYIKLNDTVYNYFDESNNIYYDYGHYDIPITPYPLRNFSYLGPFTNNHTINSSTSSALNITPYSGIIDIYITRTSYDHANAIISASNVSKVYSTQPYLGRLRLWHINYQNYDGFVFQDNLSAQTYELSYNNYEFSTLLNTIYSQFCNVNLYVDNEPWALVSNGSSNNPLLDIDGFLKIYNNDNPSQYELKPNTKIDYDQLYQVIYNAIRNNLPISKGDINYYDSHDTIYSPTIINNYGEDEGDESDLIDTILDYAVIPKFDTAIAQPMRQALTNGVDIMNNSITNVIPNEILFILGACFFLLLFAVVINRMIK